MQLTAYTDYALRVLMFAAVKNDLCRVEEIASSFAISEHHVRKVVHALGREGLLDNIRGKHGGFRLSRPPERINLGAVVRSTEANLVLVECFDPEENRCRLTPRCSLKQALNRALRAFLSVLDEYTLADLTKPSLAAELGLKRR